MRQGADDEDGDAAPIRAGPPIRGGERRGLVEQTLAGNSGAFDEIVGTGTHGPRLFVCVPDARQPSDRRRNSTGKFLCAFFRYLDHFRGDSKFSTWFYTIVTTTCINAAKYHGLRIRTREDRAPDSEDGQFPDPVDRPPVATRTRRKRQSVRGETRGAVREAIQTRPGDLRQVIVLKDVNGFFLRGNIEDDLE